MNFLKRPSGTGTGSSPMPQTGRKDEGADADLAGEDGERPAWTRGFMKDLLDQFKEAWSEEMQSHRQEVQREMKEVVDRVEKVEAMIKDDVVKKEDLKQEVEKVAEARLANAGRGLGSGEGTVEWDRKNEMVFGGFPQDTPRKDIIETIQAQLARAGLEGVEVFTLGKYASVGIMKFAEGGKRRWKLWLAANDGLPKPHWSQDNLSLEERMRRQKLGKVKAAIGEKCAEDALQVEVLYRRGIVKYRKEIIAKYTGDALELAGAALEVKDRIEEMWKEVESKALNH